MKSVLDFQCKSIPIKRCKDTKLLLYEEKTAVVLEQKDSMDVK